MRLELEVLVRSKGSDQSDVEDVEAINHVARFTDESEQRQGLKLGDVQPTVVDGKLAYVAYLGSREALEPDDIRRFGANLVKKSGRFKSSIVLDLEALSTSITDNSDILSALLEGLYLGSYSFETYRTQSQGSIGGLKSIVLAVPVGDVETYQASARNAKIVAEGVALARDLINEPPSIMTPRKFTEIAQEVAAKYGLELRIWDEKKMEEEKLGGLLGVAKGSNEPPRMLRLHYMPKTLDPMSKKTALVGKGITFDSGGLSLKSGTGMMTMKTDMSGAAAVLASMAILAALGCRHEIYGYMALTENMPSGTAQKPGDVLKTRLGKTIEVLNTDAEGRLVLADALALAVEDGAEQILDIATLTGACVVALGTEIGGIMGNDNSLVSEVREASLEAGEELWPLPLPKRYKKHIDSEIADMKNIGQAGQAGTLSAGLLLKEFVGDVPWVHLDIAGPARSENDEGYLSKGGTGFGVRTVCRWLL